MRPRMVSVSGAAVSGGGTVLVPVERGLRVALDDQREHAVRLLHQIGALLRVASSLPIHLHKRRGGRSAALDRKWQSSRHYRRQTCSTTSEGIIPACCAREPTRSSDTKTTLGLRDPSSAIVTPMGAVGCGLRITMVVD